MSAGLPIVTVSDVEPGGAWNSCGAKTVFMVCTSMPMVNGLSRYSNAECTPADRGFTFTSKLTGLLSGNCTTDGEENVPSSPTHRAKYGTGWSAPVVRVIVYVRV